MDIILKQDINNVGHKDDVVTVKDGFARNYLIPQGMAIVATKSALKVVAENKRQRAHKEAKLREEAEALAAKIQEVKISIGAKTSSKGTIFGSVNNIQLAEKISENGFEIDRRQITMPKDGVKEIGKHIAKIKLYRDVVVDFEFEVVSE